MSNKVNNRNDHKVFAKDIRQWVNSNVIENKFDKISIYSKELEVINEISNFKDKQCGICMNNLVVFGVDFSLRCLHAICWCCILRLRFLLKNKECPFCKNIVDCLFITSNPRYFEFIINDSFECLSHKNFRDKSNDGINIKDILKHPKRENIDSVLYNENFGVYYESVACRWTLDRVLEYRCWFTNCRPVYSKVKNIKDLNCLKADGAYKNIKSLGEHLFREHHVKCCYVCIEKRKTMLLPEHFLYGVKDLNRHMKKGEMSIKPAILPHVSCPICRIWCLDREDFSDHVRNEHFSCHICEEKENNLVNNTDNNQSEDPNISNNDEQNRISEHFNSTDNGVSKISFVYKDYTTLRQHWKSKHYPCEHEDCMFIVFENESELIFHRATHHSAVNRRGNITVPIAVTSYRQQIQRRFETGAINQLNNKYVPLNISTPSLCTLDELSSKILERIKKEKPLLWRLILIYDLNRCIQIITDELMIELGLEEKCRDFNSWSLSTINNLFSKNNKIISITKRLGYSYINKEISSFSFVSEMILLLWANSQDFGNNNILQNIKKQFRSISTSPNTSKLYFSPVYEPITVFENTLKESSGTFKRIPCQYIDQILTNDANWSILCSDVVSMILISLILGVPNVNDRKDLLKSLSSIKSDIQDQKVYILSNLTFPRFSFGNLQNSVDFEDSFTKINPDYFHCNKDKKIEQKFVRFEKLIKPEEIMISSRTSFLESLYSVLEICWPKIIFSESNQEFILDSKEREKIFDGFLLIINSQTSTEINALSSLYQHTTNIVSSANTIERILGLRAPYYRLAINISDSNDDIQNQLSSTRNNESLSHKQWLNICCKALNKICIYDIQIIMLYCQACIKTLNDSNFILKEQEREKLSEQVIEVKPIENRPPKTVNANSEVISYKEFSQSNSGILKSSFNNNWLNKDHKNLQNLAFKTVLASSSSLSHNSSANLMNDSQFESSNNYSSYASKAKSEFIKDSNSNFIRNENKLISETSKHFPALISEDGKKIQTNIKKNNSSKWVCMLCTHLNSASKNRCQICSTKK